MNGFNPNFEVSMYGESQPVFDNEEAIERLATPAEQQEAKLLALSETERQELLADALERYSDLESLIHAITRLETTQQETLF